jgi:hypothetical protein
MKRQAQAELTWTKAILIGMGISALLLITLAWLPSFFTYWWDGRNEQMIELIQKVLGGREIEPYTSTRVRDAISMGFQTFFFAAFIVIPYIWGERRRRRMGLRGADEVKGYLPGK